MAGNGRLDIRTVSDRRANEPRATERTAALWAVAKEMAGHYGPCPGVRAVLLGGSVSRGWADRWSDIELVVCWETMPSPDAMSSLATSLGVAGRRVFPFDPESRTHEEEFA